MVPLRTAGLVATAGEFDAIASLRVEDDSDRRVQRLGALITIALPDPEDLSWSDVFEMREKRDRKALAGVFRNLMRAHPAPDDDDAAAQAAWEEAEAQRRAYISDNLDNCWKQSVLTVVKTAAGTFPPIAWLLATLDISEVWNQRRRFPAMALRHDLEEIAAGNAKPPV